MKGHNASTQSVIIIVHYYGQHKWFEIVLVSARMQTAKLYRFIGGHETENVCCEARSPSIQTFQIKCDRGKESAPIAIGILRSKDFRNCETGWISSSRRSIAERNHAMAWMKVNFNTKLCFPQKTEEKTIFRFIIGYSGYHSIILWFNMDHINAYTPDQITIYIEFHRICIFCIRMMKPNIHFRLRSNDRRFSAGREPRNPIFIIFYFLFLCEMK